MDSLQKEILSLDHQVSAGDIMNIALRMLSCMNREIISHSFRTAYLALNLAKYHKMHEECNVQRLVLISLFHTIGYFHEEPLYHYSPYSNDLTFFSRDISTESKYLFASYYLEYMTPIGRDAHALAAFNCDYDEGRTRGIYQEEYKNIIYFCARISEYISKNPDKTLPQDLMSLDPRCFDPHLIKPFQRAERELQLVENIRNNNYQSVVTGFLYGIEYDPEETKQIEMLLIYLLDFKSTSTMKHCVNTSCFAFLLDKKMQLNHHQLSSLYISALLHDLGKIATPQRILEFPGKLSPEDMGIMRYHVNHSKRLLTGFVPDDILENVYRHHEKLNGQGYPCKIAADQLTTIQRILTVADITSALNDSRSYKAEFSKEKTLSILKDMTDKGELDPVITNIVIADFDGLLEEVKKLQQVLKVDLSKIFAHYNSYIYRELENTDDEVEKLDDLEELEEI